MLCELRKGRMFLDQVPIHPFTGQTLFNLKIFGMDLPSKTFSYLKTKIKNLENIESVCLSCQHKCI